MLVTTDWESTLLKALLGEKTAVGALMSTITENGREIPRIFEVDKAAADEFYAAAQAAAVASAVDPWAAKVDEQEPLAKGGPEGASWHDGLDENTSSFTDCLDKAMEEGGLYAIPNLHAVAETIEAMEKYASTVWGIFEMPADAELMDRSAKLRSQLVLTRGEQLLLTLFSADGHASYTAEERDAKTRQIRTLVGGVRPFKRMFKPVFKRACEALKGK